ncbi:MAG: hypothetical protein Q9190_006965 [Brigantiaea leucoxantha]
MATTTSFGDTNSGLQAGIVNGSLSAAFHHHHLAPGKLQPLRRRSALTFANCARRPGRKSQLAIEHVYRTQERLPETWVFWIHASSVARFEQSYRDVADLVKIFGRKDPKVNILKLVHDWLRDGKNGSWLLVLDNVDDTHLSLETGGADPGVQGTGIDSGMSRPMSAYLPHSQHGSILITSRNKGVALELVEEKDIIVVEPMAQSHALALFEKKLGSLGDGNDVAELAAALEYMPLAIVQSAAYVCQRAPRCSVRQYLDDFRKSDSKKTSLLNYKGGQLRRDWQAKNSIIITWQISFEYMRSKWPSAADLLSLMSFFDRQGIPEFLVRNRAQTGGGCGSGSGSGSGSQSQNQNQRQFDQSQEKEDGEENGENSLSDSGEDDGIEDDGVEDDGFEDDVQVLRNYSFISCDSDRTFGMHALVQLATRKWLEAHEQLEPWKQQYVRSLSAAFPSGEYENWVSCQALFPHAKSAIAQRPKAEGPLSEWASLTYNAAGYTWSKGDAVEAVQLSKKALEVRKKILGQEHKETLSSMGMVGLAYRLGGRWKEAEELQVQVMETSVRVLGEEHPNTLSSMNNLASTYGDQGRWKEAEELQVQVMETSVRVLGEEHPDTLNSIANLASTYWNQGRWKKAEKLQVQVIETSVRVLGEEHPNTLTCMNNLALTYRNQGRWKEAEELQVQVIETRKRVLSEGHPNTLTSIANLALTYWDQGRWKEAEELGVQVMETSVRVLGEEHPDTLSSMNNLALI